MSLHPPTPTASGFCQSDGLKIYYETFTATDDDATRPIVLVHGWGADIKRNWIDTGWVEALRSVRRVIALDCRGHGKSDKPHEQKLYSYAAIARDVLAVMDHLKISKADYFGYSMGAFMGAHLLGHNEGRFTSMIMGGIGDETEESKNACVTIAEALRAKDPAEIKNPLGLAYRAFVSADPNNDLESLALSALQMWPEGYPLQIGGAGLGKVKIPVLIANGAADHPYVDSAPKLAAAIPGAEIVTIPDADHLRAVTDPRLKEVVLGFLNKH